MSSIYKKGRDGYFYYQTYVLNPKTGKKDKRIFHSLGTKDRTEAEAEQVKYDNKYDKSNQENFSINRNYDFSYKYLGFGLLFIISGFFTYQGIFLSDKKISESRSIAGSAYETLDLENKITKSIDSTNHQKTNLIKKEISNENEVKIHTAYDKSDIELVNIPESKLPNYNIMRVERLSEVFEQGKIFITIDEYTAKENLLMLCKKIAIEYAEFSNIVICLYSNTKVGRNLALGNELGIGTKDHKIAWLAMYTYNPVEGDYFDDNPSQHLGVY